jgi:histidinol-phosphate phosphatase family protein
MVRGRPTGLYAVVVPTVGRPSLALLLHAVAGREAGAPEQIVVVDDRPAPSAEERRFLAEMVAEACGEVPWRIESSGGRGPAAARNAGWRVTTAEWIVFLDDDVVPGPHWRKLLIEDLTEAGPDTIGVQARLDVPLPTDRRPTDWERATAGLVGSRWITADMAYRRWVLAAVGGFDERFRRAYREDTDLGLRASRHGAIVDGRRTTIHPVRPAPWHVSVGRQAGNADDPLMRRIHGRGWRDRAAAPPGRRRHHLATTAALAAAGVAAVTGRRRIAVAAGAAWALSTADFARRRITAGPRSAAEVATMVATSAAIPPVATGWWLRGLVEAARTAADPQLAGDGRRRARAVLVDRDGTIVEDVPYNGNPALVQPMPGALASLDRLRALGIPVAIVSNQSGIGSGRITAGDVEEVNARTAELLGPFDAIVYCPHVADDACTCRKPAPGLVHRAAHELGVDPTDCVVIGDIGADVGAARAAGARSIIVPTGITREEEIATAPAVATDLDQAVSMVLSGCV